MSHFLVGFQLIAIRIYLKRVHQGSSNLVPLGRCGVQGKEKNENEFPLKWHSLSSLWQGAWLPYWSIIWYKCHQQASRFIPKCPVSGDVCTLLFLFALLFSMKGKHHLQYCVTVKSPLWLHYLCHPAAGPASAKQTPYICMSTLSIPARSGSQFLYYYRLQGRKLKAIAEEPGKGKVEWIKWATSHVVHFIPRSVFLFLFLDSCSHSVCFQLHHIEIQLSHVGGRLLCRLIAAVLEKWNNSCYFPWMLSLRLHYYSDHSTHVYTL